MPRSLRLLLATALLLCCFAVGAQAAPAIPKDKIEGVISHEMSPAVRDGKLMGAVVGVVDGEHEYAFGFGVCDAKSNRQPDRRTEFEIGSLTKVFTGLLLADQVLSKRVGLDDDVFQLLPKNERPAGAEPITLEELATHASGLPRMPANFAPREATNPYVDYTPQQMFAALRAATEEPRPHGDYQYSNLGAGLLGYALAQRAGTSYEQLVTQRICRPLGMSDTTIALSDGQRARLATGHDDAGHEVPNWDLATLAGAGGLRSTVDDLLRFMSANLQPKKSSLAEAIVVCQQPRRKIGPTGGMALGWHLDTKRKLLFHNGQTGGYHSFLAIDPQQEWGVVILSNSAVSTVDTLGFAIFAGLRALRPGLDRPAAGP